MSASPRVLALALMLAPCLPTPAHAQAPADSDSEPDSALVVLLRADSARALLVQPPGAKGASFAHFVRAPFHLLGATLALGVSAGYAVYQLFDETGVLAAAAELDRTLDASDVHARPDFIGSRSWPALAVRWDGAAPLFVEAGASLRGYTLVRGGIALGDTLTGLELAGARHDMNQLHFWGVGPDSDPSERSDYQLVRSEAALAGWFPIAPRVRVRIGGGLEQNEIGRGEDDARPDVQDVFPNPRFAVGRDRFARGAADLDLDFTHLASGDQLAGVRLLGGWSLYRGIDDTDARFQTARTELRLFAPVSTRHSLALRGLAAETFGEDGGSEPFYHLHALGDDDGLRGFRSWRFRDRALAAGTAEWRYRVWYHPGDLIYRLDAMAFVDHGMVAATLADWNWRDAETTPGIGLRFVNDGRGMVEVFAAFGGEQGMRWGFQLGSTF